MKVLITGGAGFIGSFLADRLIDQGDEVFVVDDLSTGSLENVRRHRENERFHFQVDTVLNEELVGGLVAACDHVYHLAAAVGVRLIMDRPVETLGTNVKGTEVVLAAANRHKRKVLIASTSEVYGKIMNGENSGPLAEDVDRLMGATTKRRWAYACSKAYDEFLALAYYQEKKLPVVIARLFNTVGPRQSGQFGMVLPTFVQKALLGKPITVFGDGRQSRSFTHVLDVVEAMIGLMNEQLAEGQVVNVGNEREISIAELAQLVKEMTGSSSPIEYMSYENAYGPGFEDMKRRSPDLGKLRSLIGFEPRHDLESTVQSVIDYHL